MQIILSILLAFNFVGGIVLLYYYLITHSKEKKLRQEEDAKHDRYHHVVDEALSKERKILEDATDEADKIITDAEYINRDAKEEVDKAIKQLVLDIQKDAEVITRDFTSEYSGSLKRITLESLNEFHTIMTGMQSGLKQQITDFHQSLLPQIEKELEVYKQQKMKSVDQTVMTIIQKASQEIFNKSLSTGDHQTLVTDALEKAKKEGIFE